MRRLAVFTIVLITAVVTAVLTSLFWIAAYNMGGSGAPTPTPAAPAAEAATKAPDAVAAAPNVPGPAGLAIPVAGVRAGQLVDTFTQARAGGARVHDAIDIMAPAGTPVFAAAEGTVERLFFSDGGGGITAYVRSPDRRWTYYYAHLQSYAPGLREGQRVARGDPIGFVGSTGNANPAGPHLHFAILRMEPGERWWQGIAINPYPLLAGSGAAR
ncbi:MAG TPA: M23 family metallopeptidase [Allosphingosinicella sp.]